MAGSACSKCARAGETFCNTFDERISLENPVFDRIARLFNPVHPFWIWKKMNQCQFFDLVHFIFWLDDGEFSMASFAASSICPYGTPTGHAVSQARQPKHRSIGSAKSFWKSIFPSAAIFTRLIRPRGEADSTPIDSYVGHAGKQ